MKINRTRVTAILLAICMLMGLTACWGASGTADPGNSAGAAGRDEEVVEVIFANVLPEDDSWGIGTRDFIQRLEERAPGRFNVTVYYNGELTSVERELFEMVRAGTLSYIIMPGFEFAAQNSDLSYWNLFSFPYLFEDREDYNKLVDSDWAQEHFYSKTKEQLGVYSFPGFVVGHTILGTTKTPVYRMEDTHSLKIRAMVGETHVDTVASWGAAATTFLWSEVYTALQQNALEGVLSHGKIFLVSSLYDVVSYVTMVESNIYDEHFVVNAEWLDGLPDDLREIFIEELEYYKIRMREEEEKRYNNVIAFLEDNDTVEVIYPEPLDRQEFVDTSREYVYNREKDLVGQRLLEEALEQIGIDFTFA